MAKPRPLDRPLTLAEQLRFWKLVDKDGSDGCWLWEGKCTGAHGGGPDFRVHARSVSARRLAVELTTDEPLDTAVKLHPTCRQKLCVNPEHLIGYVGGGRIPSEKCRRGHEYTEENTYWTSQGRRACKTCIKIACKKRRERYLKEGRGWGSSYKRTAA